MQQRPPWIVQTVTLKTDFIDRLDSYAAQTERTREQLICDLLDEALERREEALALEAYRDLKD
jgi:predicted transcriptional regulator